MIADKDTPGRLDGGRGELFTIAKAIMKAILNINW
jgi:hypothetical protein